MKEISVFKDKAEAIKALDNGGRFYSLLAKANDGVIDNSELAKVAGTFGQKQRMILFLDMALQGLALEEQEEVINYLSNDLRKTYLRHKSSVVKIEDLKQEGQLNTNIITIGFPKIIEIKDEFEGFVMAPVVSDKVTTMIMIPLIEQYQVYELYDTESDADFVVTHHGKSEHLPGHKIRIGGVIKEMKLGKNENSSTQRFLEAHFYSELD